MSKGDSIDIDKASADPGCKQNTIRLLDRKACRNNCGYCKPLKKGGRKKCLRGYWK